MRRRTVVKSSSDRKVGQRRSSRSNAGKDPRREKLSGRNPRWCPGSGILDEPLPAGHRRDMSFNRRRLADRRFAGADGEAKACGHTDRQRADSENHERRTATPAPPAVETCSPKHVENFPSDRFQHRGPSPWQASTPLVTPVTHPNFYLDRQATRRGCTESTTVFT